MNTRIAWTAGILLAIGLAAVYFLTRDGIPDVGPAATPALPAPEAPPAIRHPVPETQTASPLPALQESDGPALAEAAGVIGQDAVERFLIPENVIRRAVVTIDNLPRRKLSVQQRPVAATPGPFVATGAAEVATLSVDNYARYEPLVLVLQSADAGQLAATYFRWYPLFQQAYADLGYPDRYFNDRLVEVIDHLLETPEIRDPVRLVQPKVFYEFADPALESRSAGQKLLIRMGPRNAGIVKQKLRELRAQITDGARAALSSP